MKKKTEKGDNSIVDLEHFSKKINQVIYTLDTICDPNIMTLAEAVLEVFCSQTLFGYNEKTGKGRQFNHEFR